MSTENIQMNLWQINRKGLTSRNNDMKCNTVQISYTITHGRLNFTQLFVYIQPPTIILKIVNMDVHTILLCPSLPIVITDICSISYTVCFLYFMYMYKCSLHNSAHLSSFFRFQFLPSILLSDQNLI